MLKPAIFVCTLKSDIPLKEGDFFGVDRGAFFLAKKGIKMKVAMGDFDSVTEEEKELIKNYADRIIELNPIKNKSDTQEAIELAESMGYTKGILIGAIGKRMDHSYVNFRLMNQSSMQIEILDEYNKMYILEEGVHSILKSGYPYLSLFSKNAEVSLAKVKYPLEHYQLNEKDLIGLSNEILDQEAILEIMNGKVLIIQSKD